MVQTCSFLLLTAAGMVAALADQDGQELVGTWQVVAFNLEGKAVPPDKLEKAEATITADRITVRLPKVKDGRVELTYKLVPEGINLLDAKDKPDFDPLLGVVEVTAETARIAFNNTPQSGKRPEKAGPGKDVTYIALKKVQK